MRVGRWELATRFNIALWRLVSPAVAVAVVVLAPRPFASVGEQPSEVQEHGQRTGEVGDRGFCRSDDGHPKDTRREFGL